MNPAICNQGIAGCLDVTHYDDESASLAGPSLALGSTPPDVPLWWDDSELRYQEGAKPPVRAEVLREAERLITGDRNKTYGEPVGNFTNIADLWNVRFRHKLKDGEVFTPADVASAQILTKVARQIGGSKRDHWTDIAGYAGCGAEVDE